MNSFSGVWQTQRLLPTEKERVHKCEIKRLAHSGAVCVLASRGLELKNGRMRDSTNVSLQPRAPLKVRYMTDNTIKQRGRKLSSRDFQTGTQSISGNVQTLKSESHYNLCKCLIVCLGMKQYSVQTGFIILIQRA